MSFKKMYQWMTLDNNGGMKLPAGMDCYRNRGAYESAELAEDALIKYLGDSPLLWAFEFVLVEFYTMSARPTTLCDSLLRKDPNKSVV